MIRIKDNTGKAREDWETLHTKLYEEKRSFAAGISYIIRMYTA